METSRKVKKCADTYRSGLFQGLMIAVLLVATILLWVNVWYSSTQLNIIKAHQDFPGKDTIINESTGVLVVNILAALFVMAVFIATVIVVAISRRKRVVVRGKLICDETIETPVEKEVQSEVPKSVKAPLRPPSLPTRS